MNTITKLNELITKNSIKFVKNYFNDSFIKDVIEGYFNYIDECFLNHYTEKTFANKMVITKEKILLLYLVKLILKEDNIMILKLINI